MTTKLDEYHRGLVFWHLHGREGIATEAEVEAWVADRIDHELQNLSDLKAESERKGQ
jgi:hypothetical protein